MDFSKEEMARLVCVASWSLVVDGMANEVEGHEVQCVLLFSDWLHSNQDSSFTKMSVYSSHFL